MMVRCSAVIEHPKQRENLRQCLNILGIVPCIYKDVVSVSFDSEDAGADKFIELFEHYSRHEIHYV